MTTVGVQTAFDVVTTVETAKPKYALFGFGSAHQDVVMFAFADGATRPLSKSINLTILNALATRDGSERVSDEF